MIASEDGFGIEPCAATEDGVLDASLADGSIRLVEVVLPCEEVVLRPRRDDVNEVVGDGRPLIGVLGEVLAGADVHAAIDLARVRTEDL